MHFGAQIRRFDVVGSTQDVARDLALAGAAPGTVVAAAAMTAGRGRQGRAWHTPPGANVCLTAVGEVVPLADAWQVALVGGVAACAAIREALVEKGGDAGAARVRYPNDVLLDGRKVCGVLVETVSAGARGVAPLVGIGINVLAPREPLPPEVAAIATSLEAQCAGGAWDVRAVEGALLRHLGDAWTAWRVGGLSALLARWRPLLDPEARRDFILDGVPTSCRVLDLTADGTLRVERPDGTRVALPAAAALME